MSEQDLSQIDDPAFDGGESVEGDQPDDGWSPVTGAPPPGTEPVVEPVDDVIPPHEVADEGLVPPPPDIDGAPADLAPPPPPDTSTELPPEPPPIENPVDLGVAPGDVPMPPGVDGTDRGPSATAIARGSRARRRTTAAPSGRDRRPGRPDPGAPDGHRARSWGKGAVDLDLGDGAPLMPPATDTGATTPAPTPDAPTGEVDLSAAPGDLGVAPPMGNQPTTTEPGDLGAAPPMGNQPATTEPLDGTAPVEDPGTDLGTDEAPVTTEEPATDEGSVPVAPGAERLTASAVTGWFLDSMEANDPLRDRMVDLVEQYAADGEITMAELQAAFDEAGMTTTPTDGQESTLGDLVSSPASTAAIATTAEGTCVYVLSPGDGVVELQSLRTGSVYAADPGDVARAWRDSGSTVIAPPAPEPPVSTKDAEPASAESDVDGGSNLRNVFVAGAILLPMAGGAAFLATRKLR